jgi:hypothetical protein
MSSLIYSTYDPPQTITINYLPTREEIPSGRRTPNFNKVSLSPTFLLFFFLTLFLVEKSLA